MPQSQAKQLRKEMVMLRLGQGVTEAPILRKDPPQLKVKLTQTINVSAKFKFKR